MSSFELDDSDGNKVQLIQINNHWSKFDWKGEWNKDSEKWTPQIKKKVDFAKNETSFWMNMSEF